ncbi:MAG: hypothetical protein ACLRFJ_03300 [Alphaproteobacteria bacterium]
MIMRHKFLSDNKSRGGIMAELLLSVALAMMAVPFIFKYQQDAITRAENIEIANQMTNIQTALERYISVNRENLMKTVGKNITRLEMRDLEMYGVDSGIIDDTHDKYQLRILKSFDSNNQATLQGVVVYSDSEITPLRTRQLVAMGGNMGFVDGTRAYGAFGAWRTDTVDLGISDTNGIIQTTQVKRDNALYLWRVPSGDAQDATMLSSLSLGEHDLTNVKFLDITSLYLDEKLNVGTIAANQIIFENRTNIDSTFSTDMATVFGSMSSDSRGLDVTDTLLVNDVAKFSNFTADDLYVSNLTLSGFSIGSTDDISMMRVNDRLDMTYGRINAMYVSVGFAGSITPRLVIRKKIQDTSNPNYYWDATASVANFADLSIPVLNDMAPRVVSREAGSGTYSGNRFSSVAANSNSTVGDFLSAIADIEAHVRAKYNMLNLE